MSMPRRITKLTNVQTQEVSLVRRGANNKRFALTKSKESKMHFSELLKTVLETEAEGEDKLVATLKANGADEDAIQVAVANYRLQNGFRDQLSPDEFNAVAKAAGYQEKAKEPPKDKDEDKADAAGKPPFPGAKPPFKAKSEKSADMNLEMDRVLKAQQNEIEALRKESQGLQEILKAERAERIRKEYVAKCAKEFPLVPGMTSDEMGEMLQKAYEVSDEFGQNLEKQWTQTQASLSKSQLLVNQGFVSANDGSPVQGAWGKIQELAKQRVQKADGGLSEAKALDMVLKENPDLYQEYLNENPAQTTGVRD
jgi:hypothetical protein